ncbi:unnamed protein product [Alopecurus aequalis]
MGDLNESLPEGVISLPVIDLSRSRHEVSRAILDAGKNIGLFKVINHGVTEQAMRDMEAACREFFALPAEDKAAFYLEDNDKTNRYFSGTTYETGGNNYWTDCLRVGCSFPVDGSKNSWPDKPENLREVVPKLSVLTRDMGMEVLPPQCDRNLLSLLLPSTVPGLQYSFKGEWINVHPLLNAFIVNLGLPLEVVSNGMLKSIEHRVVTNMTMAQTSVGMFITPTKDCLITPAMDFVGEENPPRYHPVTYREFNRIHGSVKHGLSSVKMTSLENIEEIISTKM